MAVCLNGLKMHPWPHECGLYTVCLTVHMQIGLFLDIFIGIGQFCLVCWMDKVLRRLAVGEFLQFNGVFCSSVSSTVNIPFREVRFHNLHMICVVCRWPNNCVTLNK